MMFSNVVGRCISVQYRGKTEPRFLSIKGLTINKNGLFSKSPKNSPCACLCQMNKFHHQAKMNSQDSLFEKNSYAQRV